MNKRILISGAGVAGQDVGDWLPARVSANVVERAPGLRRRQGVEVRDHAITSGRAHGVMAKVQAAAADVVGMQFVNA